MDYEEIDRGYVRVTKSRPCFTCGCKTTYRQCTFGGRDPVCEDCWPFVRFNLGPHRFKECVDVFYQDGDWQLGYLRTMSADEALSLLPQFVADAFFGIPYRASTAMS